MTPTDLEAMLENLNHRVTRIEQILPTLATRSDLRDGLDALGKQLREELAERFDDAKRYALVLHEDLKSDLGLSAEHLADVMSRLPPRER